MKKGSHKKSNKKVDTKTTTLVLRQILKGPAKKEK